MDLQPTVEKEKGTTAKHMARRLLGLEADVKETRYSISRGDGALQKMAHDQSAWLNHVGGLCLRRGV